MRKKVVGLSFAALFVISALAAVPASADSVEWSEPVLIGGTSGMYRPSPAIASNDDGWQVVAWSAWNGLQDVIYVNRFEPQSGWAGVEALGVSSKVVAGIDDEGRSTVAWIEGSSVLVARYVPENDAWDELTIISDSGSQPGGLQLSVCSNGGAAAVWSDRVGTSWDWGVYVSIRDQDSSWSDSTLLQQHQHVSSINIAMDDAMNAVSVYSATDAWPDWNVFASRYVHGQGWEPATTIENQAGSSRYPKLAMNGDGFAVATWHTRLGQCDVPFANVYVPGSGWGVETSIEDDMGFSSHVEVSVDDEGNAVAAWRLDTLDRSYFYIRANIYDLMSGWADPITVDEGSYDNIHGIVLETICAAATDGAYVAWMKLQSDVSWSLCANHYSPSEGWGGASIVAEMTNVTSMSMTPNEPGGATVVWAGLCTDWGIYVSSCPGSGTPSGEPEAAIDLMNRNDWRTWKFDGRESTDDGRIVDYLWDFGDDNYADTKVAWHTYQKAGDYTVTLTVWDDEGNSDSTSITLSVRPNSGE